MLGIDASEGEGNGSQDRGERHRSSVRLLHTSLSSREKTAARASCAHSATCQQAQRIVAPFLAHRQACRRATGCQTRRTQVSAHCTSRRSGYHRLRATRGSRRRAWSAGAPRTSASRCDGAGLCARAAGGLDDASNNELRCMPSPSMGPMPKAVVMRVAVCARVVAAPGTDGARSWMLCTRSSPCPRGRRRRRALSARHSYTSAVRLTSRYRRFRQVAWPAHARARE